MRRSDEGQGTVSPVQYSKLRKELDQTQMVSAVFQSRLNSGVEVGTRCCSAVYSTNLPIRKFQWSGARLLYGPLNSGLVYLVIWVPGIEFSFSTCHLG